MPAVHGNVVRTAEVVEAVVRLEQAADALIVQINILRGRLSPVLRTEKDHAEAAVEKVEPLYDSKLARDIGSNATALMSWARAIESVNRRLEL